MNKPKVIVTRRWPQQVETELAEQFDAHFNEDDHPMSVEELSDAFSSADAVFSTVTDSINTEVLSRKSVRARLIGNYGVGFNNIDLEAAKKYGLAVTNTPEVLTEATADLAMTLLLAIARRAGEGERQVRSGNWAGWRPTHLMGTHVTGKTLGLIGFGRIGQAVAKRAHHGFDMRVIAYDPFPPDDEVLQHAAVELYPTITAVLKEADFVSLHCPATPENRHLINDERLKEMRANAFLINSARGDIVDEAALVKALDSGNIAGAGLDVYETEPQISKGLMERQNVVLLPHLGSATIETRIAMGRRVLENALAFFSGTEPKDRVA